MAILVSSGGYIRRHLAGRAAILGCQKKKHPVAICDHANDLPSRSAFSF